MVSWHRYVVFLCVAHHRLSFVALQVWQVYRSHQNPNINLLHIQYPISLYYPKHIRMHQLTALLWWLIFPLLSVAW